MGFWDKFRRFVRDLFEEPEKYDDVLQQISELERERDDDYIADFKPNENTSNETIQRPKIVQKHNLKGLDATSFRPLTSDEAKLMIGEMRGSWQSAYLDPLNRIPSAKLPRIQVIDRSMVGLGFLTPEELVEIHEIGSQMDEARGELTWAREQAQVAVEQSKEAREARKKQKQEEAARRREKHANEVAERHRTDIFFLGRDVSHELWDRRANIEKLERLQLPVLSTPMDLARALEIDIPKLRWLAFHNESAKVSHYRCFTIPKKSGGKRQIFAPQQNLAACQKWILLNILIKVPIHDAAHGFICGRSIVTNAQIHLERNTIVNMDMKDFFPTVTYKRVRGIFKGLGYSPAVATILALICTESPRRQVEYDGHIYHVALGPRSLPQGACTSPALSNLVVRRLDARLTGLCRKRGWTYTRYADDMTFSSQYIEAQVGHLMAAIRHIVEDEGFRLNKPKTRVLRPHASQRVTGIVVNERPGVPRKTVRRLRAILHNAKKDGLESQNRDNHPHFASYIQGMLSYISMVNHKQAEPLIKSWEELHL